MASKEVFVASSYSSKVNYSTGLVFPDYKDWLENVLNGLEDQGYSVFNALRVDKYRIETDPVAAYKLDRERIEKCDALLAILEEEGSEGVQTEVGLALGLGKTVLLAHTEKLKLGWFNQALVSSGVAHDISMPLDYEQLSRVIEP